MGMGFGMANQMAQAMAGTASSAGSVGGASPLPQQAQFFVAPGNQQSSPFGLEQLKPMVVSGQITRDSGLAQRMAQWGPAGFPSSPPSSPLSLLLPQK